MWTCGHSTQLPNGFRNANAKRAFSIRAWRARLCAVANAIYRRRFLIPSSHVGQSWQCLLEQLDVIFQRAKRHEPRRGLKRQQSTTTRSKQEAPPARQLARNRMRNGGIEWLHGNGMPPHAGITPSSQVRGINSAQTRPHFRAQLFDQYYSHA